ncbi:hypothetical protein B0H67DRAFT_143960 [Lasiosphaeris hirsuta]|uniref:Uncharacterized protein n=1 Tax=Lasiosphaeris hirsuta TaxID=260670 RepID=A0AA40B1H4_9PEZI|nr:hypothetical protein B0H67DRAFT_143960 [Lasiosphaeris hirsuta]
MIMDDVIPPYSSSSDEGRSPRPSQPRPEKRRRNDHESNREDGAERAAPRTTPSHGGADSRWDNFITLHEECAELEKTGFHFPDLHTFVAELNLACQAKWETRHVPYHQVIALLVCWEEDDLGVVKEIESLEIMLRDSYNFEVATFTIPSVKKGYLGLVDRVRSLLEMYDVEDNLFILYYGGHARQDEQPQTTWVSLSLQRHDDGLFKRDANGCHRVEPYRQRTPIYHWLS